MPEEELPLNTFVYTWKDGTFGKKPSTIFGCARKNLKKVKP